MRFLASEISVAAGGDLNGPDVPVEGASHDSRELRPGELFVAVVAERDGHDYVSSAVAAGAPAYLSSRGPLGGAEAASAILVEDTIEALGRIGRLARARITEAVVGITGSVGKTTVKDMVKAVLSVEVPAHASSRSFNNEIGVPLTLIGVPEGAGAVVVEMGARGLGHISALCEIAGPTVGLVTRVALAHGEAFGSVEEIARGKSELVEALPRNGFAVLNAGDERVLAMSGRTEAEVVTYGVGAGDVRAGHLEVADDLSLRFVLETPWGRTLVAPAVRGRHNAENAVAAAATGLALGASPEEVAAGLEAAEVSPLRMSLRTLRSGALVLDDTYNANPTSMRAALDALAHLDAVRRIAVLGPMAELGVDSDAEHESVAQYASSLGLELLTIGAPQYRAPQVGGSEVAGIADALDRLVDLRVGTAVLVKASRVAGLERLVASLG